jgi:hypothetical protein
MGDLLIKHSQPSKQAAAGPSRIEKARSPHKNLLQEEQSHLRAGHALHRATKRTRYALLVSSYNSTNISVMTCLSIKKMKTLITLKNEPRASLRCHRRERHPKYNRRKCFHLGLLILAHFLALQYGLSHHKNHSWRVLFPHSSQAFLCHPLEQRAF